MQKRSLSDDDLNLIEETTAVLESHFEADRHRTACGIRTASGAAYNSINLVTNIGAAQVHCEPIAPGMGIMNGE